MSRVRMACSLIFACVSLTLFLNAGPVTPVGANQSGSNVIHVWTVGSPHTGALPARQGMDLGQQSILAVLRNHNGDWRLLAITHDPLNTWAQRPVTNTGLFVNALDQEQPAAIASDAARLLTPEGMYPLGQPGDRFGDFIWQPSQSSDVIGQVVEFTWGKDTNWNLTRLFFLPVRENKLSSGNIMDGGATTWRVWTISKAGDVTFSDPHSFIHR